MQKDKTWDVNKEVYMGKFPMDQKRWQTGLTLDQFVAGMKAHQADMRRRLREVVLPAREPDYFARVESLVHVLVMTEDWCGDSLMNLPILARLVEVAPGMDMRIFVRGGAPDLNDHYTARGITHIPVFTFLGADFDEIGTWVERPQAAHARIGEWMATHPEVAELLADTRMTTEERHRALQEKFGALLSEMEGWYTDRLQAATVAELNALLAAVVGTIPLMS